MAEPRPLYIFDLDGTLTDAAHRQRILDEKWNPNRWREFYAACDRDSPIKAVIGTMERLRCFADVWIFTGRSEEVRDMTVAWLAQFTSFMTHELDTVMTMRAVGDHRPDDCLKAEWLANMTYEDRLRLVAVFEDRARVVAMWRAAGIPCFQVAPGDF